MVVEQGVCCVETCAGEADATATIRALEQDAIDLLTGKLEAEYALHAGKFEAAGNLRVLALLEAALSPDEQPFRCLLSGSYPPEALQDLLLARADWHPYPTIEDRAGWEALPASVREALLDGGEHALEAPGQVVLFAVSLPDGRCTGRGGLSYDVERFALTTKEVVIRDERLGGVWGERLTRLVFTARDPAQQDVWAFHIYPVG